MDQPKVRSLFGKWNTVSDYGAEGRFDAFMDKHEWVLWINAREKRLLHSHTTIPHEYCIVEQGKCSLCKKEVPGYVLLLAT